MSIAFDDTSAIWSVGDLGPFEDLVGDRIIGYIPNDNQWAPVPGLVMRPANLTRGSVRVPDYIILTAPGLDGTWLDTLARHRADLCGFDVAIIRTDSIISQFSDGVSITPTLIRDFTETMWNWGQPSSSKRPSYLLLIGDSEDSDSASCDWFLPVYTYERRPFWLNESSIGDDDWYVYFDEPYSAQRSLPDMMVGRISVRDQQTLQDIIDVIRAYEAESSSPAPDSLSWRRYLTYLKGEVGPAWKPDSAWVDSLRQWCGYSWDHIYGGDFRADTTGDGSSMTSLEWDSLLNASFSRGQQLAIYINHGIPHAFSAGMDWTQPTPPKFQGLPDSTFDCFDVDSLEETGYLPHGYPFVINACCGTGRFFHTEEEHTDTGERFYYCFNDNPAAGPVFDYGIDCIGERFIKNTEAGAIGFFAGTGATYISHYNGMGQGLMSSILYYGNTRIGDAIAGMRFQELYRRLNEDIALYNLLGDPAVDLGDRVKFRNCCDLIVSPPDLEMVRYPTRPIGGGTTTNLSVTIRNAGAMSSGGFDAELEIEIDALHYDTTLKETFTSISSGLETTQTFDGWEVPSGLTENMTIVVTCSADPDEDCSDSWTPNNEATRKITIIDLYPNEQGWPVYVPGSVKSPPALGDLDDDGDLEIVLVAGNAHVIAIDPSDPDNPMWTSAAYMINPVYGSGYSIPSIGDITGDGDPEVVIDTIDKLVVLDGSDGDIVCFFAHDSLGMEWSQFPHSVVLADIYKEAGGTIPRDEIALLANDMLYILRLQSGSLSKIDSVQVISTGETLYSFWITASELDGNDGVDLVITTTFRTTGYSSSISLYSSDNPGDFYDARIWSGSRFMSIPAVGDLGSGNVIALSKLTTDSHTQNPIDILDASDLSTSASCSTSSTVTSNNILCCILANWDIGVSLDRVIAPSENQCFTFEDDGTEDWYEEYSQPDYHRPPFPALADLNGDGVADLLIATRDGFVCAYDEDGYALENSGFPYMLPAEVYGGFVIADIDGDEKVEVIFGTMDNYLHVWELGDCDEDYAPWMQIQHDAMRTGALE